MAQSRRWIHIREQIQQGLFWPDHFKNQIPARLEDFPLSDYGNYKNSIQDSLATGVSSLTGQKVLFWGESSGTTGYRKIFPLTQAFHDEFQMITGPQARFLATKFPKFLSDPFLFFVASKPSEISATGIPIGFISYSNYCKIPKLIAGRYGFPIEVFETSEIFYKWGPLYALSQDLSAIAAIIPSMIFQMGERILNQIDEYWPYLEGQKSLPEGLPPLKISAKRLKLLQKNLKTTTPLKIFNFRDVWPNLQFVTCWTSSTCGMQLPELRRWIGPDLPIVEGAYCATEAWMTVPIDHPETGTVLHPGSHIIEFLPVDSKSEADLLKKAWQLEIGKRYEIVLTTSMGFVRYRLRDVIMCKGFYHQSPILEFVGKSGSMISIGQVRFSEENLAQALKDQQFQHEGRWIFGPDAQGVSLVFYTDYISSDLDRKLMQIQKHLAITNYEYQDDLDSHLMKPLRAVHLPFDNPFWKIELHAQAKPKILTEKAP